MLQENIGRKAMLISMLSKDGFDPEAAEKLYKIEMQVTKHFEYGGVVPDYFELQDIEMGKEAKKVYWVSNTTESICPFCGEKSTELANEYYHKEIQDIPVNGMAIFHVCRVNKYKCRNPGCKHKIFTERTDGFCDEDARKTERFKKYCVLQAMQSNCHAAEQTLKLEGAKVSNDTISRYAKAVAAKVIEESLRDNDVEIISVDDVNLRKGDKSSACTVFIDEKTHRVLIIIRGTNKEAVAQVLEKFTSSKILSRDRASAYSSAATEANKTQVADRFHLIKNAQAAVKEALMSVIPARIFVREGNGWMRADGDGQGDDGSALNDDYFYVPDETVNKRVRLAKLTEKQEAKYRSTLKILELAGKGMRTADIAKSLGMNMMDVQRYRRVAVETLKSVDKKIEKNIAMMNSSQQQHFEKIATRNIKTIGPKAHPSSGSIVEPFRETVTAMLKEGHSHRTIYPVLKEMGFDGCSNAIYQYIVKVRKENLEEARPNEHEKPQDLNLESVTHGTVYRSILKEASKDRIKKGGKSDPRANGCNPLENDSEAKTQKRDLSAPDDSLLPPEIRKIMFSKGKSDEAGNPVGKSAETDNPAGNTEAKKN
jgi:hypothetical protein